MNFLNYIILMAPKDGAEGGGMGTSLLMMGMIVVVFYFFMIRPQMKQRKELSKFRNEMKEGDKVMTMGGIHGKIGKINEEDTFVMLEVEGGMKMKVEKSALVKSGTPVAAQR